MSRDDPRHGTANGYNNQRCRCDACREAWRQHVMARRRRQGVQPRSELIVHGANRYQKGCRCDVCRKGASLRRRSARRRNQGMRPMPNAWKYREGA